MRWKINKVIYLLGSKKIEEKFLLIPMTINGERRWLEKCKYECEVYDILLEIL